MWYYVNEGKKIGPMPDFDISRCYNEGLVNDETKVWIKGQKGWLALKDSSLFLKLSANRYSESNRRITTATMFFRPMLAAFAIANLSTVGFNFLLLRHLDKIINGRFESALQGEIAANVLKNTNTLISLILFLLFLVLLRTGFKWIYAAALNARAMDRSLTISPSFSAWSFFIPFINLIAPFKALKDIYKTSLKAIGLKMSSHGYAFVLNWWFLNLYALVMVFFNDYMVEKLGGDVFRMRIYLSCYTSVCIALVCLVWILLISAISSRQMRYFGKGRERL